MSVEVENYRLWYVEFFKELSGIPKSQKDPWVVLVSSEGLHVKQGVGFDGVNDVEVF